MRINVHAFSLPYITYISVPVRNFTFSGISFIGLHIHAKRFYVFGGEENCVSHRNVSLLGIALIGRILYINNI